MFNYYVNWDDTYSWASLVWLVPRTRGRIRRPRRFRRLPGWSRRRSTAARWPGRRWSSQGGWPRASSSAGGRLSSQPRTSSPGDRHRRPVASIRRSPSRPWFRSSAPTLVVPESLSTKHANVNVDPLRPTQPGHPSVGRCNEYRRLFQQSVGRNGASEVTIVRIMFYEPVHNKYK